MMVHTVTQCNDIQAKGNSSHIITNVLSCLLSSRLQAIPLFRAYWLGTFILGMIQIAVGHYYDFLIRAVTGT